MRGIVRSRTVVRGLAVVGAWTLLGLGSLASGGTSPGFTFTVDPTSGVPGTTVTVTAYECGVDNSELAQPSAVVEASALEPFLPGSGQLLVTVSGWGPGFEPFEGGTNDGNGVATATFQVPNVAPGSYTVTAECVDLTSCRATPDANACSAPELRAAAFGTYPGGSFLVTAPAVTPTAPAAPVIEAQATTTG
jgi:hypothetical protein